MGSRWQGGQLLVSRDNIEQGQRDQELEIWRRLGKVTWAYQEGFLREMTLVLWSKVETAFNQQKPDNLRGNVSKQVRGRGSDQVWCGWKKEHVWRGQPVIELVSQGAGSFRARLKGLASPCKCQGTTGRFYAVAYLTTISTEV